MAVNDRMTAMSKEDLDAWEKVLGIEKEDSNSKKENLPQKEEPKNEAFPNGTCWEDWL